MMIDTATMALKKQMIYCTNCNPEYPDISHNGVCQKPQANPTIMADFNGLNLFCISFNTNPLHPNSSPSGPRIKLEPNKTRSEVHEAVNCSYMGTSHTLFVIKRLPIKTKN